MARDVHVQEVHSVGRIRLETKKGAAMLMKIRIRDPTH